MHFLSNGFHTLLFASFDNDLAKFFSPLVMGLRYLIAMIRSNEYGSSHFNFSAVVGSTAL